MWDLSLWELQQRGGPVMWPLLALSVLALALALDRLIALAWNHRSFQGLLDRLQGPVRRRDWAAAERACRGRGLLPELARVYLRERDRARDERDDILQREGQLLLARLEQRVRWLAIVGQLSPMLGLLGTVTGLVGAFVQVERLGGQVQPGHLASGIWEALLTTVFGLVIAIPSMALYHCFDGWTERIARQMAYLVSYLDQWSGTPGRPVAFGSGNGVAAEREAGHPERSQP